MVPVLSTLILLPAGAQRCVEYFWDTDPGAGRGLVLGQFEGTEATVARSLDVGHLAPGIHILGLRTLNTAMDAKKSNGDGYVSTTGDDKTKTFCSGTYARAFFIPAATETITRMEYSWDSDVAPGKGTALPFTGNAAQHSASFASELSVGNLTPGLHTLYVRTLSTGHRSATYARLFFIPEPSRQLTRMEYSWDAEVEPGKGTALQYTVSNDTAWYGPSLSVSGLSAGLHTLYLRTITEGLVSKTYARTFYVPAASHEIEALEYWFDRDPGVGRATRMAATLAADEDTLKRAFDVNTRQLADGIHLIGFRTLTDGTWSETKVRRFRVQSVVENQITRLEYFWNDDPGPGYGYAVDITPGQEVTLDFEADMTELGEGPHTLGVRAMSGSKAWSPASLVGDIAFEGWDVLQDYLNSLEDTWDVYSPGSGYTREYRNRDWHALYVPFSLDYADWALHFDVARLNAFYQYDDDEDGVVDRQVLEAIIIRPGNGRLKPNHPYLIRAKQKGTFTLPVAAADVVPEEVNTVSCSTLEARYDFTGNYGNLSGLHSAQRYRLRGNTLSIPDSDDEVLPPYRWYLTVNNLGNQLEPSAANVRLRIVDDETTGLDMPTSDRQDGTACQVYDLQGRKVTADSSRLRPGIYVVNGKKQVVK